MIVPLPTASVPVTRWRLRAGAILAALKNRKVLDLHVNATALGVVLPRARVSSTVRLCLDAHPKQHIRVSPLGLHARVKMGGHSHDVRIPWWSVTGWRATS
jgi:hypothetical protein